MFGDILGCQTEGVLLAYSRLRPRVLLKILQCSGQLPRQRVIQLQMPIAPRWRNPDLVDAGKDNCIMPLATSIVCPQTALFHPPPS